MWYFFVVLFCFAAGYGTCKIFGPAIDEEAGIIVHRGITYFKSKL